MKTYTPRLVKTARVLRRVQTPAERKLWFEGLRAMPWHFRRQRPFGGYIVDFYCAEARLVIELDGASHDSDEAVAADLLRSKYLQSLGLDILRFANAEVLQNLEGVVQKISMVIAEGTPPSASAATSPARAGEAKTKSPLRQ